MLTLIQLETSGYLLLTATWGAPQADLEALKIELASQTAAVSPNLVQVAFAPVASPRCDVLLGDGARGFRVVASSGTSGNPPYDAVFNLTLQDEELAAARAATSGEPGRLAVEYEALLPTPVSVTATFTAAGPALRDWIASHGGGPDLIELLDTAVQEGVATVHLGADGDVGLAATEVYARLLEEAARLVWLDGPDVAGDVALTVSLDTRFCEPVRALADIGTILAADLARMP